MGQSTYLRIHLQSHIQILNSDKTEHLSSDTVVVYFVKSSLPQPYYIFYLMKIHAFQNGAVFMLHFFCNNMTDHDQYFRTQFTYGQLQKLHKVKYRNRNIIQLQSTLDTCISQRHIVIVIYTWQCFSLEGIRNTTEKHQTLKRVPITGECCYNEEPIHLYI